MIYDVKCNECNHEDEWVCSVSQYEKRKTKYKCPKCGKVGTTTQDYTTSCNCIILKGTGWTRSFISGHESVAKTKSQREHDKELKRNDQLRENCKTGVGNWGKKNDAIKRGEDLMHKERGY